MKINKKLIINGFFIFVGALGSPPWTPPRAAPPWGVGALGYGASLRGGQSGGSGRLKTTQGPQTAFWRPYFSYF